MGIKGTNTAEEVGSTQAKREAKDCLKAADQYIKDSLFDKARHELDRAKTLDPTNLYIDAFQDRISYFEQQQKKDASGKTRQQPQAGKATAEEQPKADFREEERQRALQEKMRKVEEEYQKHLEEQKKVSDNEARKLEEERHRVEEEARRMADAETNRKAEEEGRLLEEEQRRKGEQELKQLEEQIRQKSLTETTDKLLEERRKVADLQKRLEEEEQRRLEEEVKRLGAERRKIDEQARGKAEEEAKRKVEAKRRHTEEEERKKTEEELKRLEEKVRRKVAAETSETVEDLRRKLQEEERRRMDLEEERKRLEGERRRIEEEARHKAEEGLKRLEETIRRKAEEDARRKVEEELRKHKEEDEDKRTDSDVQRRAEEQGRRRARMKKLDEFLTRAEELLTEKEFDDALTEVSKALALDPMSEDAQRLFEEIDKKGKDEIRKLEARRARESLDRLADQFKGTILLISSDPAVNVELSKALKSAGYGVVLALNPESALEKMEKVHPNIILCDVEFSKENLSGIKFLQVLRLNSKFGFVPFIFLCNANEMSQLESSELRPIEGFVQKPVDFDELTRAMNEKLKHFKDYISTLTE